MNTELNNASRFEGRASNTPGEVRFRCPHCQKLYKTGADVFDGSSPEFDCSACQKTFLLTQAQDSFGLWLTSAVEPAPQFEKCPKCSNLKPEKQDECPSCGVFASKFLQLQRSESPALFELNQNWQKVMENFNEDSYHQDFLNKCHQKLALNFAFLKYSELQKTLGFDSLCAKYIKQIDLRLEQQFQAAQAGGETIEVVVGGSRMKMTQWILLGVGAVGMVLLIFNRFVPTFPNLNGLLMMLTVLAFSAALLTNNKTGIKL